MIHRMRRLAAPEYPFSEEEFNDAFDAWGCNCGPGALAMMLGVKPDAVRAFIPNFDERRYTSPSMMAAALSALRVEARNERTAKFATYGLCRVQWEGPWTEPGANPKWAYRQTHWIGSMWHDCNFQIFDINGGWRSASSWVAEIVPALVALYPRANGKWHLTHRWELLIGYICWICKERKPGEPAHVSRSLSGEFEYCPTCWNGGAA